MIPPQSVKEVSTLLKSPWRILDVPMRALGIACASILSVLATAGTSLAATDAVALTSESSIEGFEKWYNVVHVGIENHGDRAVGVWLSVERPEGWSVAWGDSATRELMPGEAWSVDVGVLPPDGSAGTEEVLTVIVSDDAGGVFVSRPVTVRVKPADQRPPDVALQTYRSQPLSAGSQQYIALSVENREVSRNVTLRAVVRPEPWLRGEVDQTLILGPGRSAMLRYLVEVPRDATPGSRLEVNASLRWNGLTLAEGSHFVNVREGVPLTFETLDFSPSSANVSVRNVGPTARVVAFDAWDLTLDAPWWFEATPSDARLEPGEATTIRITTHGTPPAYDLRRLLLRASADGGRAMTQAYVHPIDLSEPSLADRGVSSTDPMAEDPPVRVVEDVGSTPPAAVPVARNPAPLYVAGGLVAVSTAWVATRDNVRWTVAALFTRLKRSALLDQPSRQQILLAVSARPGITFSELKRKIGIGTGATVHHLRIMLAEGVLVSRRDGQFRRFYANGSAPAPAFSSTRERLLTTLENGPRTAPFLADQLGISRQAVHEQLQRLAREGLVTWEEGPAGKTVRLAGRR